MRPTWSHELRIARDGFRSVAGLDESGRGCLAGPVVAAAVILPVGRRFSGVNDCKLLTALSREELLRLILRKAGAWSIGTADAEEIDSVNILNATKAAMRRAVEGLSTKPDHLLIDAVNLPEVDIPQTVLIKGDRLSLSIAAASIIAKVVRDRVMRYYDRRFPGFGFAAHKGYGTKEHLDAVAHRGACAIHRRSFRGVLGATVG